MTAVSQPPEPLEHLLTLQQVRECLNVNKHTLYDHVLPQLPVLRFGRAVRVRRSDLLRYLDSLTPAA